MKKIDEKSIQNLSVKYCLEKNKRSSGYLALGVGPREMLKVIDKYTHGGISLWLYHRKVF